MMKGTSIPRKMARLAVISIVTAAGAISPILDAAPAAGQEFESHHDVACDLAVHDHTLCSQLHHGGVGASPAGVVVSPIPDRVILVPPVGFKRHTLLLSDLPARAPPTTRHP